MCQLLETIKCNDGKLFHLEYHNSRFNNSRDKLFGGSNQIDLGETIKIPEKCKMGLFRCRVTYSEKIEKIEFLPHQFRKIESLKLVIDNEIDYHLKYSDRNRLTGLFEKRVNCDDILIIKIDCITDSFTANPVFFDGAKWWTPDTPLLPGTQRTRLLNEGKIFECRITTKDISKYLKVGLINAMHDLEEMQVISIEKVLKA